MSSLAISWRRVPLVLLLLPVLLLSLNSWIPPANAQLTKGNRKAAYETTTIAPSYRPINVTCPSRSLLRNAGTVAGRDQNINPDEAFYVGNRRMIEVASAFKTFLANDITGYDLDKLAPIDDCK